VTVAADTHSRTSFFVLTLRSTKTKAAKREPSASVSFNGILGTMHPVVRCKEHESSRRPLFDICETNEYGEVRVTPLSPFFLYPYPLSTNDAPPFHAKKRRRPSKCIATLISRPQSRSHTRFFERRGGSTTSSKRETLPPRSMDMGRRPPPLPPDRPTTVQNLSARTARRLSLHFSIRFRARGRSRVIDVILKVERRCRSPTATSTHTHSDSDSAHSLLS
jgi:hypothetical protein